MNTKGGNPSMETSFPPEEKNKNLLKKTCQPGVTNGGWSLPSASLVCISAETLCFYMEINVGSSGIDVAVAGSTVVWGHNSKWDNDGGSGLSRR